MKTLEARTIGANRTLGPSSVLRTVSNLVAWPLMAAGVLAEFVGILADSDRALFFGALVAVAGLILETARAEKGGER